MKTTILSIAILMLYISGSLQNVGIGTTNPLFKLDIRNGSINVDSVYRIGSVTVLAVPGIGNLFVGKDAGSINTANGNTFVGDQVAYFNTTGTSNSFFGNSAGFNNTTGDNNSFFGLQAGYGNNTGIYNSFFGMFAGRFNTTGTYNSFFGGSSGLNNKTGSSNSFFGVSSGSNNSGSFNSFFGFMHQQRECRQHQA